MNIRKSKILVTGGLGFIGSHTVVELQNEGFEVVIIDDLSNSKIEVLDGITSITGIKPEFVQFDLKDKNLVKDFFENHQIGGVIHFAASKAVGESVENPLLKNRLLKHWLLSRVISTSGTAPFRRCLISILRSREVSSPL